MPAESVARAVRPSDHQRLETFRRLIQEGIAMDVFRSSDPKVAELAILGAANWSVKWFRPDGGKTAREIGRDMADLLVRGLLTPGAAERFTPPCLDLLTTLTEPGALPGRH